MRKLALALLVAASACAPKIAPAPIVTAPKYPEFTPPTVPAAFANSVAAMIQSRGWEFLQSGDLKNAEREFSTALVAAPAFYPAETSLGYVRRGVEVLRFRALEQNVARARQLAREGRGDEALQMSTTAIASSPE